MIPMTPSSSVAYRELEGATGEEGAYWPSVSPGVPLSTSGDEGAGTKVRKPYTITKQRERWTEEEHLKFLEALKLYGRAWRRIEEHIGTKTAVQIRSHAQKFFSKIERDVTAGGQGGVETGVAQVIDIPPPRPKRKPTHPYPRKAGRSFGKTSEDECPLAAAGSISSSSGISTANIAEGCSKNNVWEQDDTAGEACHQEGAKDALKAKPKDAVDVATRPWGIPKSINPANAGGSSSPPARPAIVAPNAIPPLSNNSTNVSPVPVAFPATMPWARIFGGAMNPAMMNPAMMSPALMNPALMNPTMMNPQGMLPPGMMMPWGAAAAAAAAASAPNGQAMENGGAVNAIAATIAAASAWWAMQGGMPPGVMHPALGAMYLSGAPPLAIPTPYLFSQCAPQEVTVATALCVDGKEAGAASGSATHVVDEAQELPSCNGNSRSSALRRAERAQRVKESKARRMGSGNHLLSVTSDICASTSGGSGTHLTAGQVTTGHLSSENAVNSLSKGVSLPVNLNNVKQTLHDLVRKDRGDGSIDDGDENRKRMRLGRAPTDTIMHDGEESPSTTGQGAALPGGGLNAHLEKVRSVSGSNNLSGQFTKIMKDVERSSYDEEATPTDASQSCGSDGSEGAGDAQADDNERRGPSSNSSACGNAPGGTDRSGSSDGSSENEGTCNVDRQRDNSTEKNGRSSSDPDTKSDEKGARVPGQFTFNEFLPVCKDGDKHEKTEGGGSSRLPRTASIDGEQRKEVTERGQIAFQALFKRDTLPRTFSPPPAGLALATGPKQPATVCNNMTRSRSANAITCEALELRSPRKHGQDSAFNAWEHLRGTSSASKADRCESGVSIPSSRPTKSLEDLQSSERRRKNRKGRTHSNANNWLQLAPTWSKDEEEEGDEDESADSGADDQGCKQQQQQQPQQESFVCRLDLSMASQDENELHCADPDGAGTSTITDRPTPSQSLSLSVGTCLKTNAVNSVSNRTVKYSGVGFVPYQRAPPSARAEPPLVEN